MGSTRRTGTRSSRASGSTVPSWNGNPGCTTRVRTPRPSDAATRYVADTTAPSTRVVRTTAFSTPPTIDRVPLSRKRRFIRTVAAQGWSAVNSPSLATLAAGATAAPGRRLMRHPPAVYEPPDTATSQRERRNSDRASPIGSSRRRSAPRAMLAARMPPPDRQMPMASPSLPVGSSAPLSVVAGAATGSGWVPACRSSRPNRRRSAGRTTGASSGPTTKPSTPTSATAYSSTFTQPTTASDSVANSGGLLLPTIDNASAFSNRSARPAATATDGMTGHGPNMVRRSGAHRSRPACSNCGTMRSHETTKTLSNHSAARALLRPARTTVPANRPGVPANDRCW